MQAPRLELIEIGMRVEDTSSTRVEVIGAATAVALSRPRPINECGQLGTLTIDITEVGRGYEGQEEERVRTEAAELANQTLAYMGRGGWATVLFD